MTRRILRALGSRYGIAAILLVIVVMVVAVAQATSDPRPGGDRRQGGVVEEPTPGAPDDGYVDAPTESASSEPATSALPDQAVADAEAFAQLWMDTEEVSEEQWLDRLRPYATEGTITQLSGVDPANVPATEIIGDATVSGPNVTFDTDRGLLTVTMTEENGAWKVSSIDFEHQPR